MVPINSARLKAKYDYKKAANDFESANADEISDHLLNKDNNKFWRAWNNQYKNSLDAAVSVGGGVVVIPWPLQPPLEITITVFM